MRRAITILGALAICILATSAAEADVIAFNNWGNGGGTGSGPDWNLPNGPYATTDGALWIENTPGSPALVATQINMQFKVLTTGGWQSYTFLKDAGNDTSTYPGYFYAPDPYGYNGVQTGFTGSTSCEILAWTGNYSTCAAAYSTHVEKVADTGVFTQPFIGPHWANLTNMPAMDLRVPTPEPSTLLLTATGLVGLLAYAWRRRRRD